MCKYIHFNDCPSKSKSLIIHLNKSLANYPDKKKQKQKHKSLITDISYNTELSGKKNLSRISGRILAHSTKVVPKYKNNSLLITLTVQWWTGIQAGASTEQFWAGHLPWFCCK